MTDTLDSLLETEAAPFVPDSHGHDDDGGGEVPAPLFDPKAEAALATDPLLVSCAAQAQNDTGNGRRFRLRYGDLAAKDAQQAVHVENIGWFVWDGARWREDGDDRGMRPLVHRVAELIGAEAMLFQPTKGEAQVLDAGAEALESLRELQAEIEDAESDDARGEAGQDKQKLKLLKRRAATLDRAVRSAERVEKRIQARRTDRRKFGNSAGNRPKLDAMLNEARPFMSRPIDRFDRDMLALNVLNGTLFFRVTQTQEIDLDCPDPDETRYIVTRTANLGIRPHDRRDWNSKLAPVAFCFEAKCPTFDAFLARIQPKEDVREFLQRFFGYCLTALTAEQMFAVFHGEGANGKSTLVDIVARILDDYATNIPISSLMAENKRQAQEATPDLNKLPGARFVRTSEPKEGLALDESLIKELTGGEPINLRRLNQESIRIYPEFKLAISCNRKPRILGNDDGIWRRVALVPFDVQIPKAERDKGLGDKLWAERSGILSWMARGALDYLTRGGLEPPKEVMDATQEWRDDSDIMGAWARAALEMTRDPYDKIETGPLYESFLIYAKRIGMTPIAGTTFNRRLPKVAADFGFTKGKTSVSLYEGIRFRDGFDPSTQPSHTRYSHSRD